MIGIYKITNLINNKIYIGQSVHIERRWKEHCFKSSNSQISNAIQKYGKDNFKFEIIELCEKEFLDIREQYWISYYNSIIPYGYNVIETTQSIHTNYHYFDKKVIENIIYDLQYSNLSFIDLSKKYNINKSSLSRINAGKSHYQSNIHYPIRDTNRNQQNKKYCIDCGKLISNSATRCLVCNGKYNSKSLSEMPITREELKKLIRSKFFTEIGKEFQVSDNAIRKWCKKFNLPSIKKEIKQFSEIEWEKL